MKITTVGRQMTVTEDIRELLERKLAKYDRFFLDDAVAYVTLSRDRNEEKVELTVSSSGTFFRSEKVSDTFNNALDECMDAIERQIRKNKTRLERRLREGALSRNFAEEIEEEREYKIRRKDFILEPMTEDEAILQMNLLGHSFYVYRDIDTGNTCVAYRRRENEYGVIVTT